MSKVEQQNRQSWNAATLAHNSHKGDQAQFFRRGGSTLFPEELELLGELKGRSLLHLQCNCGQDSLSLATLGALVTGVDIADEAISFATALSRDTGIPAAFHREDVVQWLRQAASQGLQYDIVFSSYGVLCWLPDLRAWAQGVASVLKPGGRLVLVEFHPFALCFDEHWALKYDYFNTQPMVFPEGVGDYVAESGEGLLLSGKTEGMQEFENPYPSVEFSWGLAKLVGVLLEAGLRLRKLEEYPYSNGWKGFKQMHEGPGRRMYAPVGQAGVPLMYGLEASRD